MKYGKLFMGCLVIVALAGCGGKSAEEKSAEELAERMIEQAAKAEGAEVDVDVSSGSVKIRGTDEEGGTVNVDMDEESATITSEGGRTTMTAGAAAKIPDDFPKDVPLYEKMKVMAVQQDSASGAISVTAQSQDSLAKIAEFYKKGAESNGWAQESDMSQGGAMHMLAYSKGNRNLNLVLMGDGETTNIQLTVVKE
jgi:hypothetical protein